MAPLPIITDVFRVTLNWSNLVGVAPRNVFNVLAPTYDELTLGGALVSHFTDAMFSCLNDSYILNDIDVIALDGASATQTTPDGNTNGQTSSSQLLPATAAILSIRTAQRGPQGRGRMYIGPCCEANVASGVLDSTVRSTMEAAWTTFINAIETLVSPITFGVASYKHAAFYDHVTHQVESVVGTQRRRQDQLR